MCTVYVRRAAQPCPRLVESWSLVSHLLGHIQSAVRGAPAHTLAHFCRNQVVIESRRTFFEKVGWSGWESKVRRGNVIYPHTHTHAILPTHPISLISSSLISYLLPNRRLVDVHLTRAVLLGRVLLLLLLGRILVRRLRTARWGSARLGLVETAGRTRGREKK